MTLVDRIPPQNLEAEMAVIGSVLVDRSMLDAVTDIVYPSDFYAAIHETIFGAILALADAGLPIDKIALCERLRTMGKLEYVGGPQYLSILMDTVPTAASAEYYGKIVRDKSMSRGLIRAGTQITKLGFESEDDPAAAVGYAESIIRAVAEHSVTQSMGETVAQVSARLFRLLDAKVSGELGDRAQMTPWAGVNYLTGGFFPGEMVGWAAAPGAGKSAAILMLADWIAAHYGAVAFFCLEMGKDATVRRHQALYSGVTARRQRKAEDLTHYDFERLGDAIERISRRPITYFGREASRLADIRREVRAIRKVQPLAAIVVDHAGFIADVDGGSGNTSKHERLDAVYRALLRIAEEEHCVIHVVQHVNRDGMGGRPSLKNLRDGGNLEGHAHAVIFPYRKHPDGTPDEQERGEFIVDKCRDGEAGSVTMKFVGRRHLWMCDHDTCEPPCSDIPWFLEDGAA